MKAPIVVFFSLCVVGCATKPVAPTPDYAAIRAAQMRGSPIGVQLIEQSSDVAIIFPEPQFVFNPTPQSPRAVPAVHKQTAPPSRSHLSTPPAGATTAPSSRSSSAPVQSSTPNTPSVSIQPVPASEADVYRAWLKFCVNAAEMTGRDWQVMNGTKMPAELSKVWDQKCVQGS